VNIFLSGSRRFRAAFSAESFRRPAIVVTLTIVLFLSLAPTIALGQQPSQSARPVPNETSQQELTHRLQRQQAAVQAGDSQAITETSQQQAALALRLMGQWRLRQSSYAQAVQLLRISLELEDAPETRSELTQANDRARLAGQPLPHDLDSVDVTVEPPAGNLKGARLTPAQLRAGRTQERQLRKMLASTYNDWGTAEARQQKYSQAMVHFHEAERWDRTTPGLMRNIGLAAVKLADDKEAARALKFAVEQNPKDSVCQSLLAMALFSTKQYGEAAKHFDVVREAALSDPQMAYAWAFSLSQSNQPKQADEILAKLASNPLSADMLVAVGEVYSGLGDYSNALTCFRKAIALDPTIKKAHDDAGSALLRLDRPAEAIPELQAELKTNPGDPDTKYRLAYALLQTSQQDKAIPILREIISAHPNHARARYDLGRELLQDGKTEEAIQNLEVAANLDPDRDYIHYQLQAAYRKAGRAQDADRELRLYREIKAHNRQRPAPQF
jgi:tetratricopeptide (TPR) repeat protein